jgi:hypothetical protein
VGILMNWTLLPITVLAAVCLFIIKELVEIFRRIRAKNRKLSAIKKLLAAEIEQNNWVIKSLKKQLNTIMNNWYTYEFKITTNQEGGTMLFGYIKNDSLNANSRSKIYKSSNITFNRLVLDIATLDPKLFELCESAYDGVAEIKHVSDSLIQYVN